MCGAIESDSVTLKAVDVTMDEATNIAALCLEMTAVDVTAAGSPARLAEIAPKEALHSGWAVDLLTGWDLKDEEDRVGLCFP